MIPLFKGHKIEYSEVIASTLSSGYLGEGEVVNKFNVELCTLFGHQNITLTNSCTSALKIALRILGVGPGDEIVSSAFTMVSSASVIKDLGAKIVWCDLDEETLSTNIHDAARCLGPCTKAVIVTLIGGLIPNNFEAVFNLGVPVILDCAQAFLTYYKGIHISHWGDFACFSFQSIKHLTTGDGGCISVNYSEKLLNSKNQSQRAERLKWFGMERIHSHSQQRLKSQTDTDIIEIGYKSHMNNISAAIGLTNISKAIKAVEASRYNAAFFCEYFKSSKSIGLLKCTEFTDPSWWVFGIIVKNRDQLIDHLTQLGINSSPIWKRNDRYSCFEHEKKRHLPFLEKLTSQILFIPNGWWIEDNERKLIVTALTTFEKYGR